MHLIFRLNSHFSRRKKFCFSCSLCVISLSKKRAVFARIEFYGVKYIHTHKSSVNGLNSDPELRFASTHDRKCDQNQIHIHRTTKEWWCWHWCVKNWKITWIWRRKARFIYFSSVFDNFYANHTHMCRHYSMQTTEIELVQRFLSFILCASPCLFFLCLVCVS